VVSAKKYHQGLYVILSFFVHLHFLVRVKLSSLQQNFFSQAAPDRRVCTETQALVNGMSFAHPSHKTLLLLFCFVVMSRGFQTTFFLRLFHIDPRSIVFGPWSPLNATKVFPKFPPLLSLKCPLLMGQWNFMDAINNSPPPHPPSFLPTEICDWCSDFSSLPGPFFSRRWLFFPRSLGFFSPVDPYLFFLRCLRWCCLLLLVVPPRNRAPNPPPYRKCLPPFCFVSWTSFALLSPSALPHEPFFFRLVRFFFSPFLSQPDSLFNSKACDFLRDDRYSLVKPCLNGVSYAPTQILLPFNRSRPKQCF